MSVQPARPKVSLSSLRHVHDVIIVGGQLGGAFAAALLARRNFRVLYVEHDGNGPGYEHGGFVLPYAPFVVPSFKLLPSLEEPIAELGLTQAVQRLPRPHQPALQAVLSRARVALHTEPQARDRELTRAFPADGAALGAALAALAAQSEKSDAFFKLHLPLPPRGLLERFSVGRAVKGHPALGDDHRPAGDHPLAKLVQSLSDFLQFQVSSDLPLANTRPLSQVLRGPHRFPGGREGLRELFLKKAKDLGAEVLGAEGDPVVCETLAFEGSQLVGAKILRVETMFRSNYVISATDAGALRRLIPDKRRQRKLLATLDLSAERTLLFTVNWILPVELLPRGMGDLVLYDTADPEFPTLLVQVLPAVRADGRSEDERHRTVCASGFVPASARELGEAHLQSLADRLESQLELLLPFAKASALVRSAPYLHSGGVRGSRLQPHPHLALDGEPFLGIGGLPIQTPVKNLLLASREVLPGLGLEGELLAGFQAAKLITETYKKRNPLKR